jgi:nicotinamidase/pyrazinamidase
MNNNIYEKGSIMNNTAFIIVDAERCFYPETEGQRLGKEGFGELGVPGAEKVTLPLNQMSGIAHTLGIEVVHTLDKHPEVTAHFSSEPNYINTWPVHGVDGSDGSLLHPDLAIALHPERSTEFIKGDIAATSPEDDTSYTGALAHQRGETELLPDYLRRRGVDAVIIGGLALGDGAEHPLCVDSTAIDFKRLGFDVTVLTDATEAVLPQNRELCFKNLGEIGIKLMTTTQAAAELQSIYEELTA